MIELRLPNINAPTEKEQIKQMQDYLFQTVRQLNLNFAENESNAQSKQVTGNINNYVTKNELRTERDVWHARVNDDGEGAEFWGVGSYTKVGNLVFIELSGTYNPSDLDEFIMIFEDGSNELPFPIQKGKKAFGNITTDLQFFADKDKTEPCTNVVVEIGETEIGSGKACISFNGWYNGDNYRSMKCNQVEKRIGGNFHLSAVYPTE